MSLLDALGAPLRLLPAETAHTLALGALRCGIVPAAPAPKYASLSQTLWGLHFSNPVGMAAGFDKNAEAVDGLLGQGFGFVEVGTVTPKPQVGNAKPRLFRLAEDEAVINRMGFPGYGMDVFVANLKKRNMRGVVGANIGKNKDSEDAVADFVMLLRKVYAHADYITVNISSPNTEGLRKMQEGKQLKELLLALAHARKEMAGEIPPPLGGGSEWGAQMESSAPVASTPTSVLPQGGGSKPLFIKIAPDLTAGQIADVVELAFAYKIDGLIVSNTTTSRPDTLKNSHRTEQGGLSGKPLFALSTQMLRDVYTLSEGKIPLIGCGGISSGEDAWEKIAAGASLLQLYTGLVYHGFGLIQRINRSLAQRMEREGIKNLQDVVGSAVKKS